MKTIKGNFKLAKECGNLIDRVNNRELNLEDDELNFGGRNIVLLARNHVIKHPHKGDFKIFNKKLKDLVHEYEIGKGLKNIGINVPEMYFVGVNDSKIPFLVMERLNLTNYEKLNRDKKIEAVKQYTIQLTKAKNRGYKPGDVIYDTNCGFDLNKGKLYFFDFESWENG